MEPRFKKLDIDLPKQRLINERPWAIAGLLFAVAILLLTALFYIQN